MKPVRFLVAAASPHHSLRSATQTSHDALERLPVMRRLMSPDVTRDDYAEVLTAFHAAHSVLEPVIERAIAGDAPVRLSDFGRIDDLYADLRQLGVATTLVAVENSDLQALRSPPGALGGLYVIEGARLGGRLISEHLRRSLGSEICLHYFGGSGRRTAPFSWKAFCAHLDRQLADPVKLRRAIEGAQCAFAMVHHQLENAGSENAPIDRGISA